MAQKHVITYSVYIDCVFYLHGGTFDCVFHSHNGEFDQNFSKKSTPQGVCPGGG